MKQVTSKELKELLTNSGIIFADFGASWCQPCKALGKQIPDLETKFTGKVTFVKIDVEEEVDLATEYGIRSVPTVLIFNNGEITFKSVGVRPNFEYENSLNNILNA